MGKIEDKDIDLHIDRETLLQEYIPKDQYEARLKAILVELQLEIEEYRADYLGTGEEVTQAFADGLGKGVYYIQEKINSLKEDTNQ